MNKPIVRNHFLSSQGRRVFVQEKAIDKPITLVFIHGRCLSSQSWERQFDSSLLNPFRLVAFDLLGHGFSDHSLDVHPYSLAGSGQVLLDLIDQLQLTDFVLVGHSLGGHIALQTLPHLPNCRGVFCMTMPLTKPIDFSQMYCHVDLLMNVYQPTPTQANISTYIDTLFQPHTPEKPSFIEDDFKRTDPAVHTGITQGLLAGNFQDEMAIVRTSGVPIAIIQGAQEQVHKLDYLTGFELPLWGKQPLLAPEAGHMVQWENAAFVNTLLRSFLTDTQQN